MKSLVPNYSKKFFVEKRQAFLENYMGSHECDIEKIPNNNKYVRDKYNINYVPRVKGKVYYIHDPNKEPIAQNYEGGFNSSWNTRDILLSEGVIEIEKGNDEQNWIGTGETCKSLMKHKIHFAVFYAKGQRTPHIHIYGLFPEAKDWAEKELAMAKFCREKVPFEYFHLIDTALWGEHTIALEFSKHFRYGTIKKLLFEHVPGGENAT